jgi:hypothetical protein
LTIGVGSNAAALGNGHGSLKKLLATAQEFRSNPRPQQETKELKLTFESSAQSWLR